MSRIGRNPINIPKGVKLNISPSAFHVEGPKGKLALALPLGIKLEHKEDKIFVSRQNDVKQNRANHGTIRALINNMLVGVTQGHKKSLQILGVGFRGQMKGKDVELSLGFSHPVLFKVPDEVQVKMPKPTEIEIESADKCLAGEIAARIRRLKPPEPYKGKGIRYVDEFVKRKQGKSVTK